MPSRALLGRKRTCLLVDAVVRGVPLEWVSLRVLALEYSPHPYVFREGVIVWHRAVSGEGVLLTEPTSMGCGMRFAVRPAGDGARSKDYADAPIVIEYWSRPSI